ncbi:MAG TPA: TonB-dependent receptor, partial [Kofleriaceae bacterium]|nr:TonB-dependent receptor [Kofleriaceae bacterium]
MRWLIVLVLAWPRLAAAQPTPDVPACRSSLDGHVVDGSHEPVAGATVTVTGGADRRSPIVITDAQGRFALTGLCPGPLTVTAERIDLATTTRTIALGAVASIEIAMSIVKDEVIEIRGKAPRPTDMRSTTVLTGEALERTRGRVLGESLAEVPGVAQLESSSGMAKPIVRGQYGRRLLILVGGVRHRAQEWGLDHAPEIDPFVAGALTVVRGASGVRYGPDAIGGAVLVDPPPLLQQPGFASEAHLFGMANGLGGGFAGRVQQATAAVPGLAWQLEGSFKRFAAPSTPDYALDNTGVLEWNAGVTVGYTRGAHELRVSYTHYQAELGVCGCLHVESAEEFFANLARQRPRGSELFESDATIDRPKQVVAHDLAIIHDDIEIEQHGKLGMTLAFQHDHRREFDVVRQSITGPQYSFRLYTPELDVAYEHNPVHLTDHTHLRGTVGVVGMGQVHRYAGLQLVPDHRSYGAGAYAMERLLGHDYELEAGVRYDFLARTASLERIDYLRLVSE